jgi:dolichol-phosphate mannosyltransferase
VARNHLSVVSPVYGAEKTLPILCQQLIETLSEITESFEIVLVNDASPDDAWSVIQSLAIKDSRIKGIDLSRNFGQHAAITAGMDASDGDWVVVMDCDLQDQPKEIIKMYEKAQEGYEVVFGRRHERKDNFIKKKLAHAYRKVYDYFTENESDRTVANFGVYHRKVIDAYLQMGEQNRTFQIFIRWLGFKTASVNIEHATRHEGKSGYTFTRLMQMALRNIIAQSNKPLKVSIKFGFTMAMLSLVYACYRIIQYYLYGVEVAGWTSVIVSIYFIGGLLFANLGILGLYIGKIFDETKSRPLFVVRERTFDHLTKRSSHHD